MEALIVFHSLSVAGPNPIQMTDVPVWLPGNRQETAATRLGSPPRNLAFQDRATCGYRRQSFCGRFSGLAKDSGDSWKRAHDF